jgi:type I restriction-modification system DNA methylase subunit
MRDTSREIVKLLTRISNYTHRRPSEVFDDWLGLAERFLDALPRHLESARLTGEPSPDTEETAAYWERLRQHYNAEQWGWFAEAVNHLLDSTRDQEQGMIYRDIPGPIYMEIANPNVHAGQFFTPFDVAVVMAKMTADPDYLYQRIEEALLATKNPLVELALYPMQAPRTEGRIEVLRHFLPLVIATIKPITICDPACGSGVMLLAMAAQFPQWANELGLVQYYGQDIDHTCVSMARVNMMLYGLNGYALRCRMAAEGIELPQAVAQPGVIQTEEEAIALPPPVPDLPIGQLSLDLGL